MEAKGSYFKVGDRVERANANGKVTRVFPNGTISVTFTLAPGAKVGKWGREWNESVPRSGQKKLTRVVE